MPRVELNQSDIDKAFENTNFGSTTPDEVIFDTVLKRMAGYHAGHTAECICKELGLLGSGGNPTKKARQFIYERVKDMAKPATYDSMDRFQSKSFHHAFYPNKGENLPYVMLGLGEEAGEAQGKVKKMLRDKGGVMDEATRLLLVKELGDVIWYVACAGVEIGVNLSEIAETNVAKITSRRERGTLRGSGDER